ncbi:hypothetical protein EPUS_05494 [Endocarpon pusillum Z07020]|uniref:Apple domain-containing protein n=1 Tax=Endocarpon pusillum (strain Z07020 / HMAS-L-300199) TaxID=1263415 RepID=U1HIC1_ENDPU|nr:uncharacterized protein EPUS_05494 [Endocarpon pusillum Z07020]ERF69950.1 hypothetical protein EPUS_05494 [Endocarpon pusillum Z07020]
MVHLTETLLAAAIAAILSSAALAAGPNLLERAGCHADNCLRQLRGTQSALIKTAYCSSLLNIPVVTATAESPVVVSVTATSTATSTLDVQMPFYPSYVTKRDATEPTGFEKRTITVSETPTTTPTSAFTTPPPQQTLPSFASMCTSSSTTTLRVESACSCLSLTASTITVTPTVTSTVSLTTTVTICPTHFPLLPLSPIAIRSQPNNVFDRSHPGKDAAQCCGACYASDNCAYYGMRNNKDCFIWSSEGRYLPEGKCVSGLTILIEHAYLEGDKFGMGPCAKFQ